MVPGAHCPGVGILRSVSAAGPGARAGTVARAGPVDRSGPELVAVVYEHALLGEGVARLLRSATGAEVLVVPASDPPALTRVLALEPAVVLVESATLLAALDLTPAVPRALVIELLARPGEPDPLPAKRFDAPQMIEAVRVAIAG